ncbi:hypothetical protein PANT_7c00068 [Moesziomyces antarcticus T-34]|uniref:Uncharacterized protein n=1 Tax=Pseudozyma antarctica (strain T-34) TaxID=1151754 RepID=M9LLH5_PSEA3|nr:hypothetical protein PANT_7c00068 [Moesziomyces antarcticus T-34]
MCSYVVENANRSMSSGCLLIIQPTERIVNPTNLIIKDQLAAAAGLVEPPTKSFDPNTTHLQCNLFFVVQAGKSGEQRKSFHLAKVKAYNLDNLDKVRKFFWHPNATMSKMEWATINMRKLAKHHNANRQVLAGLSQCMSYIPAHRVAFILFTTGLTTVFLRYNYIKQPHGLDTLVNLKYFVVHGCA